MREPKNRRQRHDNQNEEPALKTKPSLREKVADVVDISRDIILNVPRIVFIGSRELTIENYEGIMEYSDSIIKISATPESIKITGKKLEIRTITKEMLFITGFISSFEFVK